MFSFASIAAATNNFAPGSKLGEGGFGPVYKVCFQRTKNYKMFISLFIQMLNTLLLYKLKGISLEEREIAKKRLSRNSGQGLVEFKNELILRAKLQHMNLVKLLGCCFQGEEKMLIYEYMPNKSLDSFLFG